MNNNKTTNILLGILIVVLIAIGIIIAINMNRNSYRNNMMRNDYSVADNEMKSFEQNKSNQNNVSENINTKNSLRESVIKIYNTNRHAIKIDQCNNSEGEIFFQLRHEATGDMGTSIYSSKGVELGICDAYVSSSTPEDKICLTKWNSCMTIFRKENAIGPNSPIIDIYSIK